MNSSKHWAKWRRLDDVALFTQGNELCSTLTSGDKMNGHWWKETGSWNQILSKPPFRWHDNIRASLFRSERASEGTVPQSVDCLYSPSDSDISREELLQDEAHQDVLEVISGSRSSQRSRHSQHWGHHWWLCYQKIWEAKVLKIVMKITIIESFLV